METPSLSRSRWQMHLSVWSVTIGMIFGTMQNFQTLASQFVQNGGFETGNLAGWTGSPAYTAVVTNAFYVHSGTYGLQTGPPTVGYLSQTLATSPGQVYILSFWMENTNNANTNSNPNQFLVNWNGGTIFNQTNVPVFAWSNLTFTVTATSTNTVLQFGLFNLPYFFGMDDISVTNLPAPPAPVFLTITKTNNNVSYSWSAVSNVIYQVQYSTNLTQTNWINLGAPITATNIIAFGADPTATNSPRFYRLKIGP